MAHLQAYISFKVKPLKLIDMPPKFVRPKPVPLLDECSGRISELACQCLTLAEGALEWMKLERRPQIFTLTLASILLLSNTISAKPDGKLEV